MSELKYSIILADVPWTYKDKAQAGKRGVSFKYPLMTIEDIKSLPVKKIAADTSILFLWATAPLIQEALDTVRAWGFTYKTFGFVWVKKNKKKWTNFWGMGSYTRSNAEVVLIGTRGKASDLVKNHDVHQIVEARVGKHSKKPDDIRERIKRLCVDKKKIELFACQKVEGWDAIGFDIDGKDIREVLKKR